MKAYQECAFSWHIWLGCCFYVKTPKIDPNRVCWIVRVSPSLPTIKKKKKKKHMKNIEPDSHGNFL